MVQKLNSNPNDEEKTSYHKNVATIHGSQMGDKTILKSNNETIIIVIKRTRNTE